MKFDWFVLPFSVGLISLIIYLSWKYYRWIKQLSPSQRKNFWKILFSFRIFKLLYEIFMEVLLHRRIFKINPLLGYMHSSFALGWFLLITFGAIETQFFATKPINHLYEPIFFKFFNTQQPSTTSLHSFFAFIIDLLLLYILSGVFIAITKRFYSKIVGLKSTTQLYWTDKVALYSLWLIFPLRFLAETSTTAIYQNGSFLTNNAGIFFQDFFSISSISYPLWWAYSIDLMIFFFFLPFSRYMHIPTEIILIALRHCGFKTEKTFYNFSKIELFSCSSCGICIDVCQMQTVAGRQNMIPAYLFQKERHGKVLKTALYDCLICGRCEYVCPVQINILNIKLARRNERINKRPQQFQYLNNFQIDVKKSKIAYYAGCMSHLTPSITRSMKNIFNKLSVLYTFIDEDGSICCGRPLALAGKHSDAKKLIEKNTELINKSGASVLVTSCPICYKVFKTDYSLSIPVLHHSEWLYQQYKSGNFKLNKQLLHAVYHDPCELSRGLNIYTEPRNILKECINLSEVHAYKKENSLCCGGSLGNFYIKENDRVKIAEQTYHSILTKNEDCLITSCPLCKKTFQKVSDKPVYDIAEVVFNSML